MVPPGQGLPSLLSPRESAEVIPVPPTGMQIEHGGAMQTASTFTGPAVDRCGPGAEHEPHRTEILQRLHRVGGQVGGITSMYEANRYCIDILDQIASARAALGAAATLLLDDHVNACVRRAIDDGQPEEKVEELMAAISRFLRSA